MSLFRPPGRGRDLASEPNTLVSDGACQDCGAPVSNLEDAEAHMSGDACIDWLESDRQIV